MTSSEVLLIVGESIKEIASLLDSSMSRYEMLVEDKGIKEAYMFEKGYSAALHDVAEIVGRMAAKFGYVSESD